MNVSQGSVLHGALLVAGTCIGGGILAFPVLTSLAGFLPSIVMYILCWLLMASTGLLFLETSIWMKGESNLISMAGKTLGAGGRWFAWVLYLFLFYCLTIAYMVGCGNILVEFTQFAIPDRWGPILFVLIIFPVLLVPTLLVGRVNFWLVIGLLLTYLGFVILGFPHIDINLLNHADWSKSLHVLPIAFTSFAYQGIVPTLVSYMHYDVPKIRKAILIGSFIPFIAYAIWEALILGIVPLEGAGGLREALSHGNNAVFALKNFLHHPKIYALGQGFAFFALVTSFIGVTLGLRDFLADGLGISNSGKGRWLLAGLILIIPLMIAISHPHIFLTSLEYAGGIGAALLLGLLPILMVWSGRYWRGFQSSHQLIGGKVILVLLALFVFIELGYELVHIFQKAI